MEGLFGLEFCGYVDKFVDNLNFFLILFYASLIYPIFFVIILKD